ncbi:MAG: PDZ domain-containing protein [Phycisphaerae bacterium]
MTRDRSKFARRSALIAGVVWVGALGWGVMAADKPAPKPAGARPLLEQLNSETQSLYREVQAGVCRVQLPPPKWAGAPLAEQDNPVHKWGQRLDPAVKDALEAEQKEAAKGQYRKITASVQSKEKADAASRPAATQGQAPVQSATGNWTLSTGPDDVLVFKPNGNTAGALRIDAGGSIAPDGSIVGHGGRVNVSVVPAGSFAPNNMALVLDAQGHLLVPICVEREQFGGEPVRVMVGPGQMATAAFVGSDRQCNITVLKLEKPLGAPVKVAADGRPTEGALTMFLAPNTGVGRLVIWTNEVRDWGVVVSMEGGVYGFARQGQFLSLAGCRPAVDQILKTGAVRRAKVGVGIAEVPQGDALREHAPALGTMPAVRVTELAPNSPAARAGLRVWDLILSLNDQATGDPSGFAAALADPAPTLAVRVLRGADEQTVTVEVPAVDGK